MRGIALLVVCCGCMSAAERARVQKDRRAREARCAAIEILPAGALPARAFHTVGAVESRAGSAEARFKQVRERACKLDADAVINFAEHVGFGGYSGMIVGNMMNMYGGAGLVATGIAVQFTDVPVASSKLPKD